MRHEKSIGSLCQLNGYLIIIILHKRILIKLCQICLSSAVRNVRSVGKLIFYAGGEYKILHRQFFDGNTHQNSFFHKKKKKSRRIRNSRTKDFPFE